MQPRIIMRRSAMIDAKSRIGSNHPKMMSTSDRISLSQTLPGGRSMKDKQSKKKVAIEHRGALAVEKDQGKLHKHLRGNGTVLHIGEDCNYDRELRRLQMELVKLQEWVRHEKMRVVVLFEGRDA